jgi:hypothetical protein
MPCSRVIILPTVDCGTPGILAVGIIFAHHDVHFWEIMTANAPGNRDTQADNNERDYSGRSVNRGFHEHPSLRNTITLTKFCF